MISIVFAQGSKTASAQLYQWDYGQQLQISGLNLPSEFEMHFQNGTGNSVTVQGTASEGVGTVAIPDECLQRTIDNFRGWIYLEDESSGKTLVTVVFYLEKRERPSDTPPIGTVTEIKGYAEYVAENAAKVSAAQQAATAANSAAQAANTAAQRIDTVFEDHYNKSQVESHISDAVDDVTELFTDIVEGLELGIKPQKLSWQQTPAAVKDYLDNVTYDPSDYSTSQIANYAPATAVASNTVPVGKTLSVSAGKISRSGFEQSISAGDFTAYNDIPNQRTPYAVYDNGGEVTQTGTLKPTHFLRQLKCVTAVNVRDLGGWACDGGTVKYGKLIRGGEPTASDIEVLVNQCGIRHELNLRGKAEAGRDYTVLGDGVGYSVFESYPWYSISDTDLWRKMLRALFDNVLSGRPVYFHCAAGADRTSTFACVIEALLGMSQSDIDKEYELTCFYSGTGTDANARRRNETDWQGLITAINAKTGSTFRDKAVNFCAELGFTAAEINAFRAALIDGTPETVTPSVSTFTVSNSLTNATSNNNAQSATQFQPYEALITPSDNYLINAVSVTMGGADITQSAVRLTANGVADPIGIISAAVEIPSVTGNIAVTVSAAEQTRENLLTMDDGLINYRIPTNGTPTTSGADGYFVTDYIPINYSVNRGFRIENGNLHIGSLGTTGTYGNCRICLYDASKNLLCNYYLGRTVASFKLTADNDDLVKSDIASDNGAPSSGTAPNDWSTVKYIRMGLALNNAASAISAVSDVTGSNLAIYAE